MALEEDVLEALTDVVDPELDKDIVSADMVHDVEVSDGTASFTLMLTTPACPLKDELTEGAEEAALSVEGIDDVEVEVDSDVQQPEKEPLPGVKNVVAVASGKGGVGKSTVAVNLALALKRKGAKVGVLDADIHGPNVPRLLGVDGQPQPSHDGKIQPLDRNGVQVMSMGFLVEDQQAAIWRGPILMQVLDQLLNDVKWEGLDYLIVDLPPGTGDVPLSLTQQIPLAGVVLVTTPERVAVESAIKSVSLFSKQDAPILGVVENMSHFVCPDCDSEHDIFGSGGGEYVAERFDVELLGRIPLNPEISEGGDTGSPIAEGGNEVSKDFEEVAEKVAAGVSVVNAEGLQSEAKVPEGGPGGGGASCGH